MAHYERLGALDASFLGLEDSDCHMHVGAVTIFDAGPVTTQDGGLDIDRIRAAILSKLHLVPRFRQRLAHIPYERNPIWIDDTRFRLAYHVRHTSLPKPGDERALKRLVGRIMSAPLDRKRPLWEMWFVEGLDGGQRFAIISKTHHCMVDGIAGADLMSLIMEPLPNNEISEPQPWRPFPMPSRARLLVDEVVRRASQPIEAISGVISALGNPGEALAAVGDAVRAIGETFAPALRPASPTPLNEPIGPHRRFDWTAMPVADLKAVKNVLGGTLNDVVLATVAGALRRFFIQRQLDPDDLRLRSLVPVSVRHEDERGQMNNRVAEMVADLPVHIENPVERLRFVSEHMADLKKRKQALGAEIMTQLAEWTVPNLLVQAVRLAGRARPYNVIVTNVPGPQIPLYFLGSPMRTAYPVVPLFHNLCLVIGLFSYNGGLFWGLNADWEQMPDLHEIIVALEESFLELQQCAEEVEQRRRPRSLRPRAATPARKAKTARARKQAAPSVTELAPTAERRS
jgi:WS/DGAT/MGAT family acyltransferase